MCAYNSNTYNSNTPCVLTTVTAAARQSNREIDIDLREGSQLIIGKQVSSIQEGHTVLEVILYELD